MSDVDDRLLRDELLRLETALAERDAAAVDGGYEAVLHAGFEEVGASGRTWSRAETLEMLAAGPLPGVEIRDFATSRLADGVILATYATGGGRPARRSSIWMHADGRWQLRYHQGTPA